MPGAQGVGATDPVEQLEPTGHSEHCALSAATANRVPTANLGFPRSVYLAFPTPPFPGRLLSSCSTTDTLVVCDARPSAHPMAKIVRAASALIAYLMVSALLKKANIWLNLPPPVYVRGKDEGLESSGRNLRSCVSGAAAAAPAADSSSNIVTLNTDADVDAGRDADIDAEVGLISSLSSDMGGCDAYPPLLP